MPEREWVLQSPGWRTVAPARKVRLIVTATSALAVARLSLAFRSPADVSARLRRNMKAAPQRELSIAEQAWLHEVAWALKGVARWLPWRSDCLVRVLAAERLVYRRNLPAEVTFQAGWLTDGRFQGHAWLTCCGVDMTGGPVDGYKTLVRPNP